MIEIRNKQYATVLDCVAGEDLQVGHILKLTANTAGTGLKAMKATVAGDATVWGTMVAYWINPRSTAVDFSGGESGLTFPLAASTDPDATDYIPSGSRMLAIGGKGVTEIRFFKSSLDTAFATTLPSVGDVLGVASATSKLCAYNGSIITSFNAAARVVEADSLSVSVILG